MSEQIDYAEMLEIPVSTLNVTKKRSKKKRDEDLKERVAEAVNERMETQDPPPEEGIAAGENVTDYGDDVIAMHPPRKRFLENKLLVGEFVAVLALCATILLTNLFWQGSAINTFFAGLTSPAESAAAVDERTYAELTPGAVVSDASIACEVTDAGILTFTAQASVYAPYGGTVQSVAQAEDGTYTVEIEHTTSFSSVLSGLTNAYCAAGDTVYATLPVGYSDGAAAVSVAMYDSGSLIRSFTVGENNDIVWNV